MEIPLIWLCVILCFMCSVVYYPVHCVIQEIFQVRDHKDSLSSISISSTIGKAASAGDNRYLCLVNFSCVLRKIFIICICFIACNTLSFIITCNYLCKLANCQILEICLLVSNRVCVCVSGNSVF